MVVFVDEKFSLPKPNAVIFDWDNTLVNSWPMIHEAINRTLEKYNMGPWSFEETRIKIHRSIKDTMPLYFGDKWMEAADIYRSHYKDLHGTVEYFPDADKTLTFLHDKNIPVSIVSNKKNFLLNEEIEKFGWNKFFVSIVGSGDLDMDKPSGIGVEFVLNKMNIQKPSEKVWFVGDSVTDMETAYNTGCSPVFFGEDNYNSDRYSKCRPKVYFADHNLFSTYISAL